jgi:N-hydroxyarylamine O-acetyltransferase
LWIHLGDRWTVDPTDSVTRIATRSRGGYCFHLNGAFSELLRALGYDAHRHVGGVHGPGDPTEDAMANHLVLSVTNLPDAGNPDGTWYVDAGLGDALYEPIPRRAGTYQQGPFTLVLDETPGGVGDWHLTHDPKGGFAGMAWRSAPTEMVAFVDQNQRLSTSPESGFVKVFTAQRRDATGVDVVRGLSLLRIGFGEKDTTIESKDELVDVLRDLFALDLGPMPADAIDAFWLKLRRDHEAWEAAGRP